MQRQGQSLLRAGSKSASLLPFFSWSWFHQSAYILKASYVRRSSIHAVNHFPKRANPPVCSFFFFYIRSSSWCLSFNLEWIWHMPFQLSDCFYQKEQWYRFQRMRTVCHACRHRLPHILMLFKLFVSSSSPISESVLGWTNQIAMNNTICSQWRWAEEQ